MNQDKFKLEFDALIEKYCEFLTGNSNPDLIEKIKVMIIYNYISKAMPPLTNHWNQMHPDAKEEVKLIFTELKRLNEEHKNKS